MSGKFTNRLALFFRLVILQEHTHISPEGDLSTTGGSRPKAAVSAAGESEGRARTRNIMGDTLRRRKMRTNKGWLRPLQGKRSIVVNAVVSDPNGDGV